MSDNVKAGEAYVDITGNDSGLSQVLHHSEEEMNSFRKKIDVFSLALGGGLVAGFFAAMKAATALGQTAEGAGGQMEALTTSINRLKAETSEYADSLMSTLASALSDVVNKFADLASTVINFVNDNKALVAGLTSAAGAIALTAATVAGIPMLIGKVTVAVKALSLALATLNAHPLIAIATLLTGALAGVGAYIYTTAHAEGELSDKAEKATKALEEQHATDNALFNRLKELNDQTSLTNEEMDEADSIIQKLNGSYNDLGLSINKTTGEIEGMAGAQKKLNEEQLKAKKAALEAEIAEKKHNRQVLLNRAGDAEVMGEGWGAYVASGFKTSATRKEEIEGNKLEADKIGTEIREKELELESLNKASEAQNNAPAPAAGTGGQSGREASRAAEAFNNRLAGNVKDTSAEARKADLQSEAEAILAPLIAERDEELTNAKRRNELTEQIAEIEENLQKNLDKIDQEEKARLEKEKEIADAEEKRKKEEEKRLKEQVEQTKISGTQQEIAQKEGDLRGLYAQLDDAGPREAERLAETIAKTNDEIASLKWKQLGEELDAAEAKFEDAQKELDAAKESGSDERILKAQQEWQKAYNEVTSAESAKENAIKEYQKQMTDAYQAQIAAIDQQAQDIDYGLNQTATSRGGSFNAAAASSVANPVEQRVAKATEDSARYLRDILTQVKDIDGGEVAFA